MIHITSPAVPCVIKASNERTWYNKIYTHLNGIKCKHLPSGCMKTCLVHTKNVTRYLCITTSFQKVLREIMVYCYNNFQDKNVTYPSQATQQQAHTELLRNPPMMRMSRWVYLHYAFEEPWILKHIMQNFENITRLHCSFITHFCNLSSTGGVWGWQVGQLPQALLLRGPALQA
jgi:hypothetical protein